MSHSADQERIESHVDIIRTYLHSQFPHDTLTEAVAVNGYYIFVVKNVELDTRHTLMVDGPRLSGMGTTPAKIQADLATDDVARRMIEANGDCFYWE
jgi:hypothetical protein